jgi:hypothetical protein
MLAETLPKGNWDNYECVTGIQRKSTHRSLAEFFFSVTLLVVEVLGAYALSRA